MKLATNFLLIESLQRFYQYYGNDLQIECPTGSGDYVNLLAVAEEIQHRIIHIFGRDVEGKRATNGGNEKLDRDPHFRDYLHFFEVSSSSYLSIDPSLMFIEVLPRGRRARFGSFSPDRLDWSRRLPYHASRNNLSPAENS